MQNYVPVNHASICLQALDPDEELKQKLEEQKRLRKEAIARKERNREAAAEQRRAHLQQKLAEQGKDCAQMYSSLTYTVEAAGR